MKEGVCEYPTPGIVEALSRGLTRSCPRCGKGKLFRSFYVLHSECEVCGLDIYKLGTDTWAFMYVTTAGLTGLVVFGMVFLRPLNQLLGRTVVLAAAVVLIPLSLPFRKGLAVAVNFLSESRASGTQ